MQLEQTDDAVAATVVEYVPAAQLEQVEDPEVEEKVPAKQLVQEEAPRAEYLPVEQEVQLEAEVALVDEEYVPAVHILQLPSNE